MSDNYVQHLIPYHFVSLQGGKKIVQPAATQNPSLLEGRIVCKLTVKTPLFIPNTSGIPKNNPGFTKFRVFYSYDQLSYNEKNCQRPENPVIPGSSLRGMLRAVHEAVDNGCMHILRGKDTPAWLEVDRLARKAGYAPCTGIKTSNSQKEEPRYDLCPTCSLFGMIGKKYACAGRIRVSDARAVGDVVFGAPRWLSPLMEPKIEAKAFYFCNPYTNDKRLKGRKFYWHHQPTGNHSEKKYSLHIEPIEKGSFVFEVYFDGVTGQELRQIAALINMKSSNAETDLCFKLGNAKPQGYGSVKTSVESIFLRRLALDGDKIQYMDKDVTTDYQNITLEDAFGKSNSLTDLMTILNFNAIDSKKIRINYPDYVWYKPSAANNFKRPNDRFKSSVPDNYKRSDYSSDSDLGTIASIREKILKRP